MYNYSVCDVNFVYIIYRVLIWKFKEQRIIRIKRFSYQLALISSDILLKNSSLKKMPTDLCILNEIPFSIWNPLKEFIFRNFILKACQIFYVIFGANRRNFSKFLRYVIYLIGFLPNLIKLNYDIKALWFH